MHNNSSTNNSYNNYTEVPRGNSTPTTRALAKSVNKIILMSSWHLSTIYSRQFLHSIC